MFAIVDIAGQQVRIEKDQKITVNRLVGEEGSVLEFDSVMLIDNNGSINVGTPKVDGAKVTATILEHIRGDKVLVFKKKRRKGYQKCNGHRQDLTTIQIESIVAKAAKVKKADKAENIETEVNL